MPIKKGFARMYLQKTLHTCEIPRTRSGPDIAKFAVGIAKLFARCELDSNRPVLLLCRGLKESDNVHFR